MCVHLFVSQLFDEVVKSLPRNKLLKVNRLMQKRFQELTLLEELRDIELEKLYPEIKEVCITHTTKYLWI
jgi:hypothetical protein